MELYFIDDDNKPWIVFCHEWQQICDGEVCVAPLSDDLSKMIAEPTTLFSASESGWAENYLWQGKSGYITDGPCLLKHEDKLLMLWSSFLDNRYAISLVVSDNGSLMGPWRHIKKPIHIDGRYFMVFEDFTGKKILTFDQPNDTLDERAVFLDFENILNFRL